jgi:colanic acid biosynthesis protein WcaH
VGLGTPCPERHRFADPPEATGMSDSAAPYEAMPVHEERVPEAEYRAHLAHMPQVCVEVVLETDRGILLANRVNHPRVWFWPGGRLYKGERLPDAARRVADEELGIAVDLIEEFGPYAHFWRESEVEPSRHTVNVPFHARPQRDDPAITLDAQHSDYRFVETVEPGMHTYVRQYLTDTGLV